MRLSTPILLAALTIALTLFPFVGSAGHDRPSANVKLLFEIVRTLEDQGYDTIVEVEFEDGVWEVEPFRDGKKLELKVDSGSGAIKSQRSD